jgi:hypothetical protein
MQLLHRAPPGETERTTAPAPEAPEGAGPSPFDLRKHLPSAAVVLLLVEVYGVSDFSVTSSMAIISSAGVAQVATGAALALLPYLLPLVCLLALGRGVQLYAQGAHPDSAIVAWLICVAAFLLSAWQNLLLVAGLGVVYVLLFTLASRLMTRRADGTDPVTARPRLFPMAVVAVLVGFFATLSDPWVAPEVIFVRATPATLASLQAGDGFVRTRGGLKGVAYPLDSGGGSLTVLARTTRRVIRLPAGDVIARNLCRYDLPSHKESLLHELVGHDEVTPNRDCPTPAQLAGV